MSHKKPAIVKGLLWGTFSGTATVSAFLLPAFIIGHFFGPTPTSPILVIGFIIFCAFWSSMYRVIASNHDLNLVSKLMHYIVVLIILASIQIFIFNA